MRPPPPPLLLLLLAVAAARADGGGCDLGNTMRDKGIAGLARPGVVKACDDETNAEKLPPSTPKYAGGGPGPAVCANRRGEPTSFKLFLAGKRKWKVKCGKGKKSCLQGKLHPQEDLRSADKIDPWLECTHPGFPQLPPFSVPAAIAAARAGDEAQCNAVSTSARAAIVRRLKGAAPKEPAAITVQVHDVPLRSADTFARLAVAATALYTLAHGYKALYYNSRSACDAPPDPLPCAALRAGVDCCRDANGDSACTQSLRHYGMHCWVDGWFLKPHWFKSLALMDAMQRYPSAKWVLSLDTDAAPRHMGWSVNDFVDWAMRSRLDPSCVGPTCWGDQKVGDWGDADIVIAREPFVPPEHDKYAGRLRVNSGVIALRNTARSKELVSEWWASRGTDCSINSGRNSSFGLYRVWGSSDQFALGQHVINHQRQSFAEVPHVSCNSPVGLWFLHSYSRKSRESLNLLGELAYRHAGALTWLLCDSGQAHPCEDAPAKVIPDRGRIMNCSASRTASWGFRWVAAALSVVEELDLEKPADPDSGRVDAACADRLSNVLAAEILATTCQKFEKGPGFAAKNYGALEKALKKRK